MRLALVPVKSFHRRGLDRNRKTQAVEQCCSALHDGAKFDSLNATNPAWGQLPIEFAVDQTAHQPGMNLQGPARKSLSGSVPSVVTTSWDDGDPLDLRMAELLAKYGVKGTFYVPLRHQRPVIDRFQMADLLALGMEIGSHTLTHTILTQSQVAFQEMLQSRLRLEDILGIEVQAFAYPKGRFNPALAAGAAAAGYRLARTTIAFRTEAQFNPFLMPTSFQFFPHSCLTHIKHSLREGNLVGLARWCTLWRMTTDVARLARLALHTVLKAGGILHIWGHTLDIERCGLWGALEGVLDEIASRPQVLYLTNLQTLDAVTRANTSRA